MVRCLPPCVLCIRCKNNSHQTVLCFSSVWEILIWMSRRLTIVQTCYAFGLVLWWNFKLQMWLRYPTLIKQSVYNVQISVIISRYFGINNDCFNQRHELQKLRLMESSYRKQQNAHSLFRNLQQTITTTNGKQEYNVCIIDSLKCRSVQQNAESDVWHVCPLSASFSVGKQ